MGSSGKREMNWRWGVYREKYRKKGERERERERKKGELGGKTRKRGGTRRGQPDWELLIT